LLILASAPLPTAHGFMIKIGIISDTHRHRPEPEFCDQIKRIFQDMDLVLHAGDLTSIEVLDGFDDLEVMAVHGNMCDFKTSRALPDHRYIKAGEFTIALTHGSGPAQGIEDRLLARFADADCIVYGHTHIPSINRYGDILMVNPGSFGSGRFGGATYAILEVGREIKARIMEVGGL